MLRRRYGCKKGYLRLVSVRCIYPSTIPTSTFSKGRTPAPSSLQICAWTSLGSLLKTITCRLPIEMQNEIERYIKPHLVPSLLHMSQASREFPASPRRKPCRRRLTYPVVWKIFTWRCGLYLASTISSAPGSTRIAHLDPGGKHQCSRAPIRTRMLQYSCNKISI